jgi:uncharacterized protein (DUF885 family)
MIRQSWLPPFLAAVLALTGFVRPGLADPAADARVLFADYDRFLAAADPIGAGERGDLDAARRWPDDSPAAVAERNHQRLAFQARLQALPSGALKGQDALNADLLRWRIATDLAGDAFDEERIPFTNDEGFFLTPGYAAGTTRLRTADQAEAYLARLAALPDYYAIETANIRRGLATGFILPRITALSAARATRGQADRPEADDPLLKPFDDLPAAMPSDVKAAFKARATAILHDKVKPAQRALADFFERDYLPRARESLGASAMPNGAAYYAYRLRRETTTDMTPDQVFDLGQSEIVRIRTEMNKVIAEAGFNGGFQDLQHYLRTDPQFYVTSREALLEKASRLAKRVDDRLPGYFGKLPRLSYGVREVPREIEEGYTSARYFEGSPEQGVAGGLMINTSHLDQRPLYELPALVSHEGAPGHHIQIALAQEQSGVPQFRRDTDVTAFVEGWALYAEQLGGEMGLYRTPYERFGLLSMEMWRACRLVIDVGIHTKGWTRDQAVGCLRDNSALAEKNIQNEVDRYIGWPGQATAYKVGELTILRLRRRAEAALGSRFDLRRFHDAVLDDGALPMTVLERRIDAWIASEQGRGGN